MLCVGCVRNRDTSLVKSCGTYLEHCAHIGHSHGVTVCRRGAREHRPRISEQARSRARRRGRRASPARVASVVPRQLRLALLRAHALAACARAPSVSGASRTCGDRSPLRRAVRTGRHRRRACLSATAGGADLRAYVWVGVVSQARPGNRARRGTPVVGVPGAARQRVRYTLSRLSAARSVSVALWPPREQRVRPRVRA